MSFYEKYLMLCDKNKKTPSGAALEMGLSKTTVNRWKNGGGITDATILKVATFFGVPKEELKGDTEQKEKPSGLPAGLDATQYTPEQLEVLNAVTKKIQTEEGCQDMYNLLKAMHIL